MKSLNWIRAMSSAVSLVSISTLVAPALAEDINVAELLSEVQSLRAEVAQLRSSKDENWMNQRRVEEVKTLVREVLQDADSRASLLAGPTAGHNGKKFFLTSEDGSFLINFGGRIQARYIANFRDTDAGITTLGAGFDGNETGFQLRRMKLQFDGFVNQGKKFDYKIVLAADRNNTGIGLEEVAIGYKINDAITVQVGRFKAPFLREELVSSGKQLTVDRSVVNEVFTIGFTEGIAAIYTHNLFRVTLMFNDGQNQGEVSSGAATRDFANDTSDAAFTGRIDYRLMGDFKQAEDFSAWSGEETSIVIGTAFHYEIGETGDGQNTSRRQFTQDLNNDGDTTDTNETIRNRYEDFFAWTVDASLEIEGFSAYLAVIGQHFFGDDSALASAATISFGNDIDLYGVVAQAAYFVIPDTFEPFVRYEYMTVGNLPAVLDLVQCDLNLVTAGANYYFKKHDAKITIDVVWSPEPLTNINTYGTGVSGLGLLNDASGNGHRDQTALRAQLQLQF